MKKVSLISVILLFCFISASSQSCLPEGIYFATQAQIDSFQVTYPGCIEIEGDVTIDGDDITSLYGLKVVTSILGDLIIGYPSWAGGGNPLLTTLEGLNNLAFIGGNLLIGNLWGNGHNLINLSGLESLISIGANLEIQFNNQLASLSGLEGLTSIGGNLEVAHNVELMNLTGLEELDSIEGDLWISNNHSLTNLTGPNNLALIGGTLTISNHMNCLKNLVGLKG